MNVTVIHHLSTTHDGGIPWGAFTKDTTSKLADFVFTLSFYAERQAGSGEYQFSEVFGMTRPGIELRVYRFGGERSTNRPTRGIII